MKLESTEFELLYLTERELQLLGQVKVLDVYESGTENFHPEGLFSSELFGRIGDPSRSMKPAYIDTKIEVFHPLIFKNLLKIKRFYGDIISGKGYAIFDTKLKDFVQSDELNGETGSYFFLQHWKNIEFKRNDSLKRSGYIDLVEKYKDKALTSKILVMPAGLRDIEKSADGRDQEGEINEYYRKILSVANVLNTQTDTDSSITDHSRLSIQNAFNSIFSFIFSILKGKRGFIQRKWASRKVFNSTRSVLTGYSNTITNLKDGGFAGWNHTTIGLAQLCKTLLPIAVNKILNHEFVLEAFPTNDNTAFLLDKKTLERVPVQLNNKTIDKWTTQQGIEGLIDNFMEHSVRKSVVEIEDHYLGLIYTDNKGGFKYIYDINDVNNYPWIDVKYVRPITWVELFYLMNYKEWNTYPMTNTRYPISGNGSIYPAYAFVKPTVSTEGRYELDEDGYKIEENKAIAYPNLDNPVFVDSLTSSPARLAGMGADYEQGP